MSQLKPDKAARGSLRITTSDQKPTSHRRKYFGQVHDNMADILNHSTAAEYHCKPTTPQKRHFHSPSSTEDKVVPIMSRYRSYKSNKSYILNNEAPLTPTKQPPSKPIDCSLAALIEKQKESPSKKIASTHRTKENEQSWRIFKEEIRSLSPVHQPKGRKHVTPEKGSPPQGQHHGKRTVFIQSTQSKRPETQQGKAQVKLVKSQVNCLQQKHKTQFETEYSCMSAVKVARNLINSYKIK